MDPFFRQYNSLKETEAAKLTELNKRFGELAKKVTAIRIALNSIGGQADVGPKGLSNFGIQLYASSERLREYRHRLRACVSGRTGFTAVC